MNQSFFSAPFIALSSVLVLLAAGCSSKASSGSDFSLHNTSYSVAASVPVAISGKNMAFLADEATTGPGGTDFNADGDKIDSIAIAVDMSTGSQTNLHVAAKALAWLGNDLYLVVDEALDGHNWNSDPLLNDLVLLHWSAATPLVPLALIDTLAAAGSTKMVAIGANLFYSSKTTTVGATLSNLEVISSSLPLVHTPIPTTDMTAQLSPRIELADEGLIFLTLDETAEGRDLNGDGDSTDTRILALLDGTNALGVIHSVALALPPVGAPLRAKKVASHDWQVGFLVHEADQGPGGGTNFNNPTLFSASWQAAQCIGHSDSDTLDNVLFFLEFASWNTAPLTSPPRNTGIVGSQKIAIANNFIATISIEADEGTCDLNGDGDTLDSVVRWTQIVSSPSPILPPNSATNLHALFDCPGGTHGLAELQNRFVIEVSESADNLDIDGDGLKTKNILAWLSPAVAVVPWDFTPNTAANFAGASWMGEQRDRTRLDVAFTESVAGVNLNAHNPPIAGEDTDLLDSVPTFANFISSNVLSYPGVAVAVSSLNSGIIVAGNFAFYRVSEAEDSRDWNNDGDKLDMILFRTSLSAATTNAMGALNTLTRLSIEFNADETSPYGAAFIATEAMEGVAGTDFNADGDTADLVIRWFRF